MVWERDSGFDGELAVSGASRFPVSGKGLDIADR
jgi:hypothetical protein